MKRVTLILTALVSLLVSSLPGSPLPASRPSPGKQALASSTPFAVDWLAEATRYFNAKDYARAMPFLRKGAETGNTYAMTNLGYLYRNGLGVTQDYDQARQWYQKAAEGGNADAMSSLGEMYRDGQGVTQDYGQARQWFQKAANAGDDEAKQALARLQADSK
jgi:uncharacterized protein